MLRRKERPVNWSQTKPKLIVVGVLLVALVCGVMYFRQQAQLNELSLKHEKLSVEWDDVSYVSQIRMLEAENANSELNIQRAVRSNLGLLREGDLLFVPPESE